MYGDPRGLELGEAFARTYAAEKESRSREPIRRKMI